MGVMKKMQKITVHNEKCRQAFAGEFHVTVKEMDSLVAEIYTLMNKHNIPFYNVVTHLRDCPGPAFPVEELELRLFTLEH